MSSIGESAPSTQGDIFGRAATAVSDQMGGLSFSTPPLSGDSTK